MSTVFTHLPLNHALRPFYRLLAAAVSVYLIVFGAVAYGATGGRPTFTQDQTVVTMGLRANRGFAEISVIAGVVILLAILVGHNVDHWIAVLGGVGFMLAGGAMMALMRTDANVLGFAMANCVVSFLAGTLLLAAGVYIGSGSAEDARHREFERHSGHVPGRAAFIPAPRRAIEAATREDTATRDDARMRQDATV